MNNPDLRGGRDGQGIIRSQLMAAGVMPNTQLTGGLDHPFEVDSGYLNAFILDLNYDIRSLTTRSASFAFARSQRSADRLVRALAGVACVAEGASSLHSKRGPAKDGTPIAHLEHATFYKI